MPGTLPRLLLVAAIGASSPQSPRDRTATPRESERTGSASISGRVTDSDTGQPLVRALVRLWSPGDNPLQREVETDDNGRYEFDRLMPGSYVLGARPGLYSATHLSAYPDGVSSDRPLGRPPRVTLTASERRDDVNFPLVRAVAIAGRVVDEAGEPMADAGVVAIDSRNRIRHDDAFTDDRGLFRVFGLRPGSYRLCAMPSFDRSPDRDVERYVRTCAPSSPTAAASEVVSARRDITGIEIRMVRGAARTVAGFVTDASGALAAAYISINPIGDDGRGGGARTQNGQFSVKGLLAGRYVVTAAVLGQSGPGDREPPSPREWASTEIQVDDVDVTGLVLATARPVSVAGRIQFEGEVPSPQARQRLAVFAEFDRVSGFRSARPPVASVGAEQQFVLEGLFGANTIGVGDLPDGWVVKAIRYKGQDITGVPVVFTPGGRSEDLRVVLTSRPATLSATVRDRNGRPAPNAAIVVFSTEERRWKAAAGFLVLHGIDKAVVEVGAFPAGEYFVAAVGSDDAPQLDEDPKAQLEILAPRAQRISLTENERRTIDLTLIVLDEGR